MASISQAAVILADYQLNGVTSTSTSSPVTTPVANIVASNLTLSHGSGFGIAFTNSAGGSAFVTASNTTDLANADYTTARYFKFTVDAADGYKASYSTVKFNFQNNRGGSDATPSTNVLSSQAVVRSSVAGFANADPVLYTSPSATSTSSTVPSSISTTYSFSLPAAYQDLETPVEFRFYAFDNGVSSSSVNRFDSFVVEGTVVAVPEPAGVLALAVLGPMCLRRRR